MKDKEKLSMYVDITRTTIILCWVVLIAFWCLKLFGGNWFEIMVENENFVAFSEIVQNTWVKYLVSFFTIFIANYFVFGAISEKFYFKGKLLFIVMGLIFSIWFVSNFINFANIKVWFGYIVLITYSLLYQKGFKKSYGFLAILLELIFTVLSMLTRNIEVQIMNNYLIGFILSIDVYIMFALYYLYINLKNLNKEN